LRDSSGLVDRRLEQINKKDNTVDRFDDVVLPVFVTAVLTMLQTRIGGNYNNVNQLLARSRRRRQC
jgi:hypothetical protein